MSKLIEIVNKNHEEIVMMFSRIMDKLKQDNSAAVELLNDPEFSIEDFPCTDKTHLEKLNMLCGTKQTVKNILVSCLLFWFIYGTNQSKHEINGSVFFFHSGNQTSTVRVHK